MNIERVKENIKRGRVELIALVLLLVAYGVFAFATYDYLALFAIGTGVTFIGGMSINWLLAKKLKE